MRYGIEGVWMGLKEYGIEGVWDRKAGIVSVLWLDGMELRVRHMNDTYTYTLTCSPFLNLPRVLSSPVSLITLFMSASDAFLLLFGWCIGVVW